MGKVGDGGNTGMGGCLTVYCKKLQYIAWACLHYGNIAFALCTRSLPTPH